MTTINAVTDLIRNSSIPESLIHAVVEQIGGWDRFTESAQDVSEHGALGGFSGFTYYADTVPFAERNRKAIATMAGQMAQDLGAAGAIELVRGFNCLSDAKPSEDEVGQVLYGSKADDDDADTLIKNALAWFALEEVCRAYCDLT